MTPTQKDIDAIVEAVRSAAGTETGFADGRIVLDRLDVADLRTALASVDLEARWISVEDRLPTQSDADENGKVLIYRQMNEGQKSLSKSVFDWFMVKNCEKDSFWQPLPSPPKPNDDGK